MPTLLELTDYRSFIAQSLDEQQRTRKDLAAALGRSAPWLSRMLAGDLKLDPEQVGQVADHLGLDDEHRDLFAMLVDLESPSARARQTAWAGIQARQIHETTSAGFRTDVAAIYTHWYMMAIHQLSSCEGFRPDPRWIADTLVPAVTVTQAQEGLSLLIRLGLLVPDGEGSLQLAEPVSWSPSDLPKGEISHAVAAGQLSMLGASKGLHFRFRQNERHTGSLTMALSEEGYQAMIKRTQQLERELMLLSVEPHGPCNRVYNLSIQLFPLSDYTDT